MNLLILTPSQLSELSALNASGLPQRQLMPALLKDGRTALNADLLTDAEPGQTWDHYAPLLKAALNEDSARELFVMGTDRPELIEALKPITEREA